MKRTLVLLPLASALLLAVGCGGGDEGSSSSSPSSGSTPAPAGGANMFAIAKGKVVYNNTCIACHGEGGTGIEGQGKDWTHSEFIKTKTDDELIAFIKKGRALDDPLSDGIAIMPPMGGDPTLTDDDLRNVVAFMRSLQD